MRPKHKVLAIRSRNILRSFTAEEKEIIRSQGLRPLMRKRIVTHSTEYEKKFIRTVSTDILIYRIWRCSIADIYLYASVRSLLSKCTAYCKRIWDRKLTVEPYMYFYNDLSSYSANKFLLYFCDT